MSVKILIVDDHPGTVDNHQTVLNDNSFGLNFEFTVAYSFQDAQTIIQNTPLLNAFDVAILDYELGKNQNPDRKNGKDLGVLIRDKMPETKIIVITSHTTAIVLYTIYEALHAACLLVKNEYWNNDLTAAVEKVLKGETYYTKTVQAAIESPLFRKGLINIIDRQIIEFVALGMEVATIAKLLEKSLETINRRKSLIRDLLMVKKKGDQALLNQCRILNLI